MKKYTLVQEDNTKLFLPTNKHPIFMSSEFISGISFVLMTPHDSNVLLYIFTCSQVHTHKYIYIPEQRVKLVLENDQRDQFANLFLVEHNHQNSDAEIQIPENVDQ